MSMTFEAYDARMRDLVLPSCALEQVHTGMLWTEGPVYFPAGDYFLWSDIPNKRLYQWVPDAGVRVYSQDSGYTNGNTRDREGRLISCRHLKRQVVRTEADGSETVLADSYDGKRLNSPNDVIVAAGGAVWFTDPTYGIKTNFEGKRAVPEQAVNRVYRVSADANAPEAMVEDLQQPNGLAFSPDESVLYVADSARSHDDNANHHVFACTMENGKPGKPQPLFAVDHGVPDGMRVDEFGNIWCSSARGVEVFAPDGTHLGCILVPETVANLEFGGPKGNRLLITATQSVYSVFVAVSGVRFGAK